VSVVVRRLDASVPPAELQPDAGRAVVARWRVTSSDGSGRAAMVCRAREANRTLTREEYRAWVRWSKRWRRWAA
jgi:hypothetical protein